MANKNKTGTYIYKFERHFETVLEFREKSMSITKTEVTRVTETVIRKRKGKEK